MPLIIHRTTSYVLLTGCPVGLKRELSYSRRKRPTRFELRQKKYKPVFEDVLVYTEDAMGRVVTQPCLFDRIVLWCKRHKVAYKVTGIKIALPRHFDSAFEDLRDYQIDAVGELLTAGYGRSELPTGSGKTHMLYALHRAYQSPTLVLVPTRDLLMQTVKFFNGEKEVDFGVVGAGCYAPAPNVISTYKSAGQLDIAAFKVIILDEAHHAGSTTLTDLFIRARTIHRFGLSGTTEGRSDSAELLMESLLGPVRYRADYAELRNQGYLAELDCYFASALAQPGYAMCREFASLEKGCIVYNTQRNDMIMHILRAIPDEEQVMVFCRQLKHMELLQAGTGIEVIHGKLKMDVRQQMLKRLVSGELRHVITTPIFVEGMNIPSLSVLINAAGGKGRIPTLQRVGRGSRVTETKNTCVYIDFYDMGPPIIERQAKQRMALLRKQGHTVKQVFNPGDIPVCTKARWEPLAPLDVKAV